MFKTILVGAIGVAAYANDRLALIKEIQSTPGVLWTAGLNARFENVPLEVSRVLRGVPSEEMAKRAAYANAHQKKSLATWAMPESFDSETNWPHCAKTIGDIRDQSMCGCCWAFAAAEAASDRLCINTNATQMVPLSAQDVCFCASANGCGGGDITSPWTYIKQNGAVTGGQYKGTGPFGVGMCLDFSMPHCHHHGPQGDDPYPAEGTPGCPEQKSPQCSRSCDAAAKSPHDDFKKDKYTFKGDVESASGEHEIAKAIMTGGPVETAFTCYDDFENYVSGIYHAVSKKAAGGHAVKLVGWGVENGVKYWKVANSWNPHWGEKGYFRIKRGTNECGIEDQVTFSSSDAKWSRGERGDELVV